MKKVILFSASLLMLSVSLNAQETPRKPRNDKSANERLTPEQRAQKHTEALGNEINLTEEQKVKINELAIVKLKKNRRN